MCAPRDESVEDIIIPGYLSDLLLDEGGEDDLSSDSTSEGSDADVEDDSDENEADPASLTNVKFCPCCQEVFKHTVDFNLHLLQQHCDGSYTCPLCGGEPTIGDLEWLMVCEGFGFRLYYPHCGVCGVMLGWRSIAYTISALPEHDGPDLYLEAEPETAAYCEETEASMVYHEAYQEFYEATIRWTEFLKEPNNSS